MAEEYRNWIPFERPAVQWFVFLAGPFAWAGQILLSYFLIAVVCGAVSSGVVGLLLHLVSIIALLVALTAGVLAVLILRYRQRVTSTSPGDPDDRSAFMGAAGALQSLLFLLVITFSWIGVYLVPPCG